MITSGRLGLPPGGPPRHPLSEDHFQKKLVAESWPPPSTLMRDGKDLDATIEAVNQIERILIGEDIEATARTDLLAIFRVPPLQLERPPRGRVGSREQPGDCVLHTTPARPSPPPKREGATGAHSNPLKSCFRTSDQGTSSTVPASISSARRLISASQASSASGSTRVSRLSIKAPAILARSFSSRLRACSSTFSAVVLIPRVYQSKLESQNGLLGVLVRKLQRLFVKIVRLPQIQRISSIDQAVPTGAR